MDEPRESRLGPAVIVVVFASPHMAAYIRALGTPVGAPRQALTDSELRSLAARHHVEFAAPWTARAVRLVDSPSVEVRDLPLTTR